MEIDSDSHTNADDVIRETINALDRLEEDKLSRWNRRNQLATEQSEQGLSRPLDDDRVLARLRARLAADGIVD